MKRNESTQHKLMRMLDSVKFHALVMVIGFIMVYPLIWLFASSLKSNDTMFLNTYSLIPIKFDAATNYLGAWQGVAGVRLLTFLGNSAFVTLVGAAGCVLTSVLAAYAFARIKFRFSRFLFCCVLVTMMIPTQVMVVPQYIILKKLNLIDTRIALVLPWFFGGGFFIFLLVQSLKGIPKELDEAAEIDGCGHFRILFNILLPVLKPSMVTAGIFAFYWIWQDFFQPLIFMSTTSKFTLPLALNMYLDPNSYNNYGSLFAMSVISLLPILIFFIIFQRYLVDGIAMDGIKG